MSYIGKLVAHIIISSIGESSFAGWYEKNSFGKYEFHSVDGRGNAIFHENIGGVQRFIHKTDRNNWIVSIEPKNN